MRPEILSGIIHTAQLSGEKTALNHPNIGRVKLTMLARREVPFAIKKHGGLDPKTRQLLKDAAAEKALETPSR